MKKYVIYIAASVVLGTTVGCKKSFLETSPYTSIDNKQAFSTPERVNAAMVGLYDIITNTNFNTHISLTQDVKAGDILVVSTGNYGRFVNEYQYLNSPTIGYGSGFWQQGFRLISNANVAINELPAAPITDAVKNDYLAEARAIRAYAYLHLVRLFAQPYAYDKTSPGIPVLSKPLSPSEAVPSRGTVEDTYNFILDDLIFAKDNMSATRSNTSGRLVLNAVHGLLARVYQDMENWPKAAEHAKLARVGFPLAPASALLDGFIDKTPEWIWTLVYRGDDNTGYLQIASFFCPYDIGYSTFRASTAFVNLFDDNDIRKKQFFVNGEKVETYEGDALQRDSMMYSRNGWLINKYYFRESWDLNVPMIRSAEMYLIEAEAEAEQSHWTEAQNALFAVQERAITGAVKSTKTGQALKDEIRDERRKELYGEGFRFYDITRKKETLVRTAPDHWDEKTLAPGDYRNVLPIPQSEREVSNIPQNAGYPN